MAANLDEMLFLVEAGVGVAVLPNYLVSDPVARGKLLRWGPRKAPPQNPVYLAWRRTAVETARLRTVRDALLV
jgi:DNA-binding transcriptional LysR family regulator